MWNVESTLLWFHTPRGNPHKLISTVLTTCNNNICRDLIYNAFFIQTSFISKITSAVKMLISVIKTHRHRLKGPFRKNNAFIE